MYTKIKKEKRKEEEIKRKERERIRNMMKCVRDFYAHISV